MKKLFLSICFIYIFALSFFAQEYKITEPYASSKTSGKLDSKSTQKYTYLYDTSLIQAIKNKDEARVKMLMYAQVNPNEKNDKGFTPLYFAAQYSTPETLTLLLDKGARINLLSSYNLTPLMAAAAAGRADNVKILLEYGADPNILDDKELTALDHAFNNHQLNAAILLNPVTTIKKATMNTEVPPEENINDDVILEPTVAEIEEIELLKEPEPQAEPQAEPEPNESIEAAEIEIAAPEEPVYNPTLDEINRKIENMQEALARLIFLRDQILSSEQHQIKNQEAASQNKTETKEFKNTKTSSTKKSSAKFGAKTIHK